MKWAETKEDIEEMGRKSNNSYRYDLVKWGGNSAVMGGNKTIAARLNQLMSGHALIAKYLKRIGKRRDMKFWWSGHDYQTRDHLFKWCINWKQEQNRLWVDGQEGEDGYDGVEKLLKKPNTSLPMSFTFISKKHFRPGGMAASEWTRSVRAVRDTPVAYYSAPGVNTTHRVAYRPPIAVSPVLLALKISPHVPSTLSSRSVGR